MEQQRDVLGSNDDFQGPDGWQMLQNLRVERKKGVGGIKHHLNFQL